MKTKIYERASLEIVSFDAKDIITTSTYEGETNKPIVLPEDIF
jgi:hypothetical protein